MRKYFLTPPYPEEEINALRSKRRSGASLSSEDLDKLYKIEEWDYQEDRACFSVKRWSNDAHEYIIGLLQDILNNMKCHLTKIQDENFKYDGSLAFHLDHPSGANIFIRSYPCSRELFLEGGLITIRVSNLPIRFSNFTDDDEEFYAYHVRPEDSSMGKIINNIIDCHYDRCLDCHNDPCICNGVGFMLGTPKKGANITIANSVLESSEI